MTHSQADTMEQLRERLAALEAVQAVRQVMARYMQLCDVPAPATRAESLQALFTEDAVWEGIGSRYAEKFGRLEGHASIVAMLMSYLPPRPHFQVNGHSLTSEDISVSPGTATGRWLMQQVSRYAAGHAELIIARLQIDFVFTDQAWKISHFSTERLAAFPLTSPADTSQAQS